MPARIPTTISLNEAETCPTLLVARHQDTAILTIAKELANRVRDSSKDIVWIEGLMQAGKSPLAAKLADVMSWRAIHLDLFPIDGILPEYSCTERIDKTRLRRALDDKGTRIVVEGLCIRDVLDGIISRDEAFVVYVAKVEITPDKQIYWRDGANMPASSPLERSFAEYHDRLSPHTDCDVGVLREHDSWKPPVWK